MAFNPNPFGNAQYSNQFNQFNSVPQNAPVVPSSSDQLSFLSPADQKKFQDLFNNSTNSLSISPESARSILLKSNLSPHNLARIWELVDINKTGDLMFPEFALALHLCNVVLRGGELPYQLDYQIRQEVSNYIDRISFNIPDEDSSSIPQLPPRASVNRSNTNDILEFQPVSNDIPNLTSQQTGFGFGNAGGNNRFLNYQPTGLANNNQHSLLNSQIQTAPAPVPAPAPAQAQAPVASAPQLTSQQTGLVPFNQLSQQQTGYTQSLPQQQQAGFGSSLTQQQTGFASSLSQPSSQPLITTPGLPQQSEFFQSKPTQNEINQLNDQATGFVPLNSHQTGSIPLNSHQTGSVPPVSNLVPIPTGGKPLQPIQQQPTGLVPISTQLTGGKALTQQPTGLVPLSTQLTGGKPLTQQQTGLVPLSTQLTGGKALTQQPTGLIPIPTGSAPKLNNQPTGLIPIPTGGKSITQPLTQQPTGLVPLQSVQTGSVQPLHSQKTGFGNFEPLRQQKTGVGQNSFFLSNLIQQKPVETDQFMSNSLIYSNVSITNEEKQLFNKIFENYDTSRKGVLNADVSAEIFRKSGLNREELEKVWDLITRPNQTQLDKESFQIGMWLVYKRLNGFDLPEVLPESLTPSSLKILDDVKRQLKIDSNAQRIKKSSNSKVDGSRFKNNDDDIKMSSSRHRRRNQETTISSPTVANDASIEDLKKQIWEKKILLEALDVDKGEYIEQSKIDEEQDLKVIDKLKIQLNNLPNNLSDNNNEKSILINKFNELTSKIPVYISQISDIDNEITNLKLELFKIKNPSSIIGTGPNGTITDADKRKAKSKALLAIKMAKLTGKEIDPEIQVLAEEENKLSSEVLKIQQDNAQKQKSIKDIQSSIDELSNGIQSALSNSKVNNEDYKKFELGIGLQPEVQEIVKKFRSEELSNRFNNLKVETTIASTSSSPSPLPKLSESPVASPVSRSSSSNFKTPEERKAYIREQAKNRMNERLAKLGITRNTSRSSSNSTVPAAVEPVYTPPVYTPPVYTPPVQPAPVATPSIQQTQALEKPNEADDESSSDDDDEEEFQRMEEIRRLKRLERDARIAELNQEESKLESSTDTTPNFHKSNPFAKK